MISSYPIFFFLAYSHDLVSPDALEVGARRRNIAGIGNLSYDRHRCRRVLVLKMFCVTIHKQNLPVRLC